MVSEIRRLSERMASLRVAPASCLRSRYGRASGHERAWVSATRWIAALSCRLPARLSRCRSVLPDQTGVGAVPLCRAKA